MRSTAGPVRANLAWTVSPTDRCFDLAVVESMSSSPGGQGGRRARGHPQDHRVGQVGGGYRGEPGQRVLELERPAVEGGGGGDAGHGRRRGRHRVAELAGTGGRHDQVGADRLVRAARGRPGQRGAEDGHRGDQGQADHEGRRRLGGPPRAAHGVLPAELARHAEQPGQRAPDHAGQRARDRRGQRGDPDEQAGRADARRAGWPAWPARGPAGPRRPGPGPSPR